MTGTTTTSFSPQPSPYDDPADSTTNGAFPNPEPDANDDIFGTREHTRTPEVPTNGVPQEQEEEEEEVELGDESDDEDVSDAAMLLFYA
ncbi:hypothetical protein C0992_003196 [Termitomyces sp. T32_za158]|nr:hypothetical protein C0992_003196 [Termitomyces sp. T32_za158]